MLLVPFGQGRPGAIKTEPPALAAGALVKIEPPALAAGALVKIEPPALAAGVEGDFIHIFTQI